MCMYSTLRRMTWAGIRYFYQFYFLENSGLRSLGAKMWQNNQKVTIDYTHHTKSVFRYRDLKWLYFLNQIWDETGERSNVVKQVTPTESRRMTRTISQARKQMAPTQSGWGNRRTWMASGHKGHLHQCISVCLWLRL